MRVVRVVPGAGAELPERQAPGELPGVDEADVDGEPPARPPASAEVQVEVELLHHEAAAAVHEEGPQGRVAAQGPVGLLHQVEDGREDDLVQETVHPEEQEPHEAGESARRGPPVVRAVLRDGPPRGVGVVLQPGQPSVEHLGEIQRQDVVHHQLGPGHQPHLLGQGVDVPDEDLQPDVDGRVEDQVEHHGPTSETPLLRVDLLQRKVGQRVHDAEVRGGEAQQLRVPVVHEPL